MSFEIVKNIFLRCGWNKLDNNKKQKKIILRKLIKQIDVFAHPIDVVQEKNGIKGTAAPTQSVSIVFFF